MGNVYPYINGIDMAKSYHKLIFWDIRVLIAIKDIIVGTLTLTLTLIYNVCMTKYCSVVNTKIYNIRTNLVRTNLVNIIGLGFRFDWG